MRFALAFLLLALGGTAHADDPKPPPAFTIGPTATWVVLAGVTTGATVALSDRGYLLGGELSAALLREGNVVGVYADTYYDWGADGAYVTGGMELGHKFFGVDGGIALRWANGVRDTGLAGRVSIGIGAASVYARYMHFARDPSMSGDDVIQVGIELKLPVITTTGH